MSTSSAATLLFLHGVDRVWGAMQAQALRERLQTSLKQLVEFAIADDRSHSCEAAIQQLQACGAQRIVVLPVGPPVEGLAMEMAARIAEWRDEWPVLTFQRGAALTSSEWCGWLRATAMDVVAQQPEQSALLLLGAGTTDSVANADLARLTQITLEASRFARVDHIYAGNARPDLADAAHVLDRLDVRDLVVVPWLDVVHDAAERLADQAAAIQVRHRLTIRLAAPSLAHPSLINLLVCNHYVADGETDAPKAMASVAARFSSARRRKLEQLTAEDAAGLAELDQRINSLLPSEYQGRYGDVQPKSMGTASLKYDEQGRVAWDQIWTSFCDLALAGGPPHRGTLLEAVTSEEALSEPERYAEVVAELERAISMVTGLDTVTSRTPGWVGVRCDDEQMAVWLMRAIIVENVMVRREKEVLYLPAGPQFRVAKEIKNVVTSIAKTVHYWSAHLLTRHTP